MTSRLVKALVALFVLVGASTWWAVASPAGADGVEVAQADIDDDGDEDNDDLKYAAAAVGAILAIALVWFFVFRGSEDDTGFDASKDSEPSITHDRGSAAATDPPEKAEAADAGEDAGD